MKQNKEIRKLQLFHVLRVKSENMSEKNAVFGFGISFVNHLIEILTKKLTNKK